MCISISATVSLGCLFTPKVYICLCQPYKNSRAANPSHGGIAGLPGTFNSTSNSNSGVLKFHRPTNPATGSCSSPSTPATAAVITAVNMTIAATSGRPQLPASSKCPIITVMAEPSSGDVDMRTSTTNECVSPSPSPDEGSKRRLEDIIKEEIRFEVSDYEETDQLDNCHHHEQLPINDNQHKKLYVEDGDGNLLDAHDDDCQEEDDDSDRNTRI